MIDRPRQTATPRSQRSYGPMRSLHTVRAVGPATMASAVLAGCGANAQATRVKGHTHRAVTTTEVTRDATVSSTFPTSSNTVNGTVSDGSGDSITITVSAGAAEPLDEVSDPVVRACNTAIAESGMSTESAITIPTHVTAEITSSMKVLFDVDLEEVLYYPPHGENFQPLRYYVNELPEVWATRYGNGPYRCSSEGEQVSLVMWKAEEIEPHQVATWDAWLIVVGAITPKDPRGEQVASQLFIRPGANIGTGYEDGRLTPHESGWVRCSLEESVVGTHSEPYLAVDPAAAKEYGCQ